MKYDLNSKIIFLFKDILSSMKHRYLIFTKNIFNIYIII